MSNVSSLSFTAIPSWSNEGYHAVISSWDMQQRCIESSAMQCNASQGIDWCNRRYRDASRRVSTDATGDTVTQVAGMHCIRICRHEIHLRVCWCMTRLEYNERCICRLDSHYIILFLIIFEPQEHRCLLVLLNWQSLFRCVSWCVIACLLFTENSFGYNSGLTAVPPFHSTVPVCIYWTCIS